MDEMTLSLATLLALGCLTHARIHYKKDIILFTYYLFKIHPLTQPNLYRSDRKRRFISVKEVEGLEKFVNRAIQWFVIPVIAGTPWLWYICRGSG